MKFNYLARTTKGEMQAGTIEASSEDAALKVLQNKDLIVIKLQAQGGGTVFGKSIHIFGPVKKKEIFVFFREMAILVDADVPLVQSLRALSSQTENKYFKEILVDVGNSVDGGSSFSKALQKYPKTFSLFAINLIKTGEVSGQLRESLGYLADYLEKEYYLMSKVRGAMIYPAFILFAFLVVGILVMVMVIPNLTSILTELGQELPWSTKIVIGASNFTRSIYAIVTFALILLSIPFWIRYFRTTSGRAVLDRILLKLPIFGGILKKTYLARLSDNLTALIKGGVSIVQSLDVSGQVIGNAVYQAILYEAREQVKAGRSISDSFERHKEFPPLFTQMVKTGEQTGKLDSILEKLSSFYNKEVDNIVGNLTQLIEPVLIVALGAGVSILIFSVFMPIYNLAGAF